jgi:hypothetical protein
MGSRGVLVGQGVSVAEVPCSAGAEVGVFSVCGPNGVGLVPGVRVGVRVPGGLVKVTVGVSCKVPVGVGVALLP